MSKDKKADIQIFQCLHDGFIEKTRHEKILTHITIDSDKLTVFRCLHCKRYKLYSIKLTGEIL